MKRYIIKLSVAILAIGLLCVSCQEKPGNGDKPEQGLPKIELTEVTPLSGTIKAGFRITVKGEGWDEMTDEIYFQAGDDEESRTYISNSSIIFNEAKIAFGLFPSESVVGKSGINCYLTRGEEYEPYLLGENLTIECPTIADGWIPDAQFRSSLAAASDQIAVLFNEFGMIDVEGAAAITSVGDFFNLCDCQATSFAGIELFKNYAGPIYAWGCPNLVEADFSALTKMGNLNIDNCPMLKDLKLSPNTQYANLWNDPCLTRLDFSGEMNLDTVNLYENGKGPAVEYLDIRRDSNNPYGKGYVFPYFVAADNALIKINWWTLRSMWKDGNDNRPGGWLAIYKAWKEHNATIEVYSSDNMNELMMTIEKYSENPNALTDDGNREHIFE
ncbi:MAG: hypothetical protein MJY56_01000 [Bacteroidales bacterium]|nr:hypothetical protein [Bacteroidales bacterium]